MQAAIYQILQVQRVGCKIARACEQALGPLGRSLSVLALLSLHSLFCQSCLYQRQLYHKIAFKRERERARIESS